MAPIGVMLEAPERGVDDESLVAAGEMSSVMRLASDAYTRSSNHSKLRLRI